MSNRSEFAAQLSLDPTAGPSIEVVIDGKPVPAWGLVDKADHYRPTHGGYAIGYKKPQAKRPLLSLIFGGK